MLDRFGQTLTGEGVEICLGVAAQSVRSLDDAVSCGIQQPSGTEFRSGDCHNAVSGGDQACPDLTSNEKAKHNGFAIKALFVRRCSETAAGELLRDEFDRLLVPFTAVIEMSALVDRDQFGGNSLVYLPKYVDPADPMFEQSDQQIEGRSFPLWKECTRIFIAGCDRIKISRVKRVLAISTLNYSETCRRRPRAFRIAHHQFGSHRQWNFDVNETVQLAQCG